MSDFGYKAVLTAIDCKVKRFLAFHSDANLDWDKFDQEAEQHFTSQTCPRCGENHNYKDFFVASCERSLS